MHREEGPKDDKEDPLGCRLLLLKIKKSLLQPFLYHLNEKNTKNLNIKCRIYGYIFPTGFFLQIRCEEIQITLIYLYHLRFAR